MRITLAALAGLAVAGGALTPLQSLDVGSAIRVSNQVAGCGGR